MKNSNYQTQIKLNKQVNHLSSFIGMPMWNGRHPTLSEVREYDRRVLEQQILALEVKKVGFVQRFAIALKHQASRAFTSFSQALKKIKNIKFETNQPNKTEIECCG